MNKLKGITSFGGTGISRKRSGRRSFAIVAVLVATTISFGALASVSFAGDASTAQYCDTTATTTSDCSNVLGETAGGGAGGTQQSVGTNPSGLGDKVGSLPFTGWDLMSLAAVAVALTASGLVMARLSGRRPPA